MDVIQWPMLGRLDELQQVCYEMSAAQHADAATHGRTGPLDNAFCEAQRANAATHAKTSPIIYVATHGRTGPLDNARE